MFVEQSNEFGKIRVNEKVIEQIAGNALVGFEGIVSHKNVGDGVRVNKLNEKVSVEVSIIVNYGVNIQDITAKIMDIVKKNIEEQVGCIVENVNVFVKGVFINDK